MRLGDALLLGALVGVCGPCFAEPCADLAGLKLADTELAADLVPEGPFEAQYPAPIPTVRAQLTAHCRVTGTIRPTPDSDIHFEVWLPASGWNGRYDQAGNAGLAGQIVYAPMVGALLRGAATASTDDGHVAAGFDGAWSIGHPEKLTDYGHRAVHLTAVVARALVERYYGKTASFNYFVGCSGGGRESLMEAQRYPEDFDGYLVGAPAIDIANGSIGLLHTSRTLRSLGPDQLTPAQLATVSTKVLEQCDALDGLRDGALRDPRVCAFDPKTLVCASGSAAGACLTSAQAEAVASVYEGPKDSSGREIAPGNASTFGTEHLTWPFILTSGPQQPTFGSMVAAGVVGALLYGDPSLDLSAVDLATAARDANAKFDSTINTKDSDLRRARELGKKILHFHGWADSNIAPQYSVDYFETVQKRMGNTSEFYRLFMVPGMPHCFGTPHLGANYVATNGDGGISMLLPQLADADHDWVRALERWVEQGVAPERVIATEFDVPASAAPGPATVGPATPVRSTRPVCPHPRVATYRGSGPVDSAASYVCSDP